VVPHGADVSRKNFFMPLDPFIVVDVAFFSLTELTTMNDTSPVADFDWNHDMQALMINYTGNCV
jgi:hypothetical protein